MSANAVVSERRSSSRETGGLGNPSIESAEQPLRHGPLDQGPRAITDACSSVSFLPEICPRSSLSQEAWLI